MRAWIDCEWDGSPEKLISLALIAENDDFLYIELADTATDEWVKEHVLPALITFPMNIWDAHTSFTRWVNRYSALHVIADWPQDIAALCNFIVIKPGVCLATPALSFEIRPDLNSLASALPHNALEDARAIRKMHLEIEENARNKSDRDSLQRYT